jgi:hypothetical protein
MGMAISYILLAQPFNASRLALGGAPELVADQIWNDGSLWGYFSVSGANLAYGVRPRGGEGQLTWFDRQGVSLGTVGAPGPYSDIALSPDGKQAAAARGGEERSSTTNSYLAYAINAVNVVLAEIRPS